MHKFAGVILIFHGFYGLRCTPLYSNVFDSTFSNFDMYFFNKLVHSSQDRKVESLVLGT